MSAFVLSQILVAIAILFDLASFQFRQRKKIVACLTFAAILIASHFVLLEQWTAACLMGIAAVRFLTSVFTTSRKLMWLFCSASLVATGLTFSGLPSVLSCTGSLLQTVAVFSQHDQRLRLITMSGTLFWITHHLVVGSPTAVVMDLMFLMSNLAGYYRFYIRPSRQGA